MRRPFGFLDIPAPFPRSSSVTSVGRSPVRATDCMLRGRLVGSFISELNSTPTQAAHPCPLRAVGREVE